MATPLDIEDIRKQWTLAQKNSRWREEAKDSYDFAAGHQWDPNDVAALQEKEAPAITFDRTGVFIDAVSGLEINNRQEIRYYPVEMGDIQVNDKLSQTAKYYENACGAQDEDSEAAKDALICGIGVTETLMDYETNPDGMIVVRRRNPLNCWPDPSASRRNLADRRYSFYGEWMPRAEAEAIWPDANFGQEEPGNTTLIPNADRAFEYRDAEAIDDEHEDQVFILHYQAWQREDYYRMKDPATGQIVSLNTKQFSLAKDLYEQIAGQPAKQGQDYVKQRRKVYYRAFISGGDFLEEPEVIPEFTFKFITYKRDQNQKIWYGMVRVMKDPQRWANKWLSQILRIINSNAKGGAFAEATAFVDPRKAEEDWAKDSPLILTKEGAVSQGKVKERSPAQYPTGLDRLMMLAFESLPMVTGVNLELLGLADREQAGVLESQRRQAAYTLLAGFFAAIREYRKERGRLLLAFIQNYIPAGALVKVLGQGGEQWVQLEKDSLTYDVRVDQAPDSPDFKRNTWEALGQILPPMLKAGYPIPPEILRFSPLPPDVAEQWMQWIKQQGWLPPEHRAQMDQMQKQLQQLGDQNQQLTAENASLKIDGTVEMLKLQAKVKDGEERNATKKYQADTAAVTEQLKAFVQAQKDLVEGKLKATDMVLETRQNEIQNLIKAFEVQQRAEKDRQEAASKKPKEAAFKKVGDGMYVVKIGQINGMIEKGPDGAYIYKERQ